MEQTLVNGQTVGLAADHRALAFGDGIFETCLCQGRKVAFFSEHMARLARGAQVLRLNWSAADQQNLADDLQQLLQTKADAECHSLKFMLLRSAPGRGYGYEPAHQQVDVVVQIKPYCRPEWAQRGARVFMGPAISEHPSLAGIKHLNRLDSVLAKAAAKEQGCDEALLVDQHNAVIEGSMSNLFYKYSGRWFTPPIVMAGVNGIIRQQLLLHCSEIRERPLFTSECESLESAFICNSLIGLVSVTELNGLQLEVDSKMHQFQQECQLPC